MTGKAFIFIDDATEDGSEGPRSMISVAGVSLLERQLRQLRTVGIQTVVLLSRRYPELLHEKIEAFRGGPDQIEVLDLEFLKDPLLGEDETALVLEEGVLLDQRILKACKGRQGTALAWFEGDVVRYGAVAGVKIHAGGNKGIFASCARIDGQKMAEAQAAQAFRDSPLRVLLGVLLADPGCQWLALDVLDEEADEARRKPGTRPTARRILWRPVLSPEDSDLAARALLAHSAGREGDFPERFIYDLPAGPVALMASKWRFPLTAMRGLTLLLGLGVAMLFYRGSPGAGLAGALVVGLLAAVARKLTRLNHQPDPVASLYPQFLNSLEYLWYLAMAYALWLQDNNPLSWALVVLIILFAFATSEQQVLETGLRRSGDEEYRLGDRLIRLFGASRNNRIWLLVPFALAGILLAGLWTLAIYTALGFFVAQRRTFHRLARRERPHN